MKNSIIIFLLIILIIFYTNINNENNKNINEEFIILNDNEFSEFSYGFSNNSKIPNIIWAFWDGALTDTVTKCIDSWKYYNPDYEFRILNKLNYFEYIDDNINSIKHSNDFIARYSDYIRISVLSKYGGIWLDASTICHQPFTWIHGIQNKLNVEAIGYFLDRSSENETKKDSPIIENWFIACIPNSQFIKDWKDEFFSTKDFESIDDYLKNVSNDGILFGYIDTPTYLTMHVSAQKILQKNKNKYDIILFQACSGPFVSICSQNWNFDKSVENLTNKETCEKYYKYPFIKLIRHDRYYFDNNENKDNAFSHLLKLKK